MLGFSLCSYSYSCSDKLLWCWVSAGVRKHICGSVFTSLIPSWTCMTDTQAVLSPGVIPSQTLRAFLLPSFALQHWILLALDSPRVPSLHRTCSFSVREETGPRAPVCFSLLCFPFSLKLGMSKRQELRSYFILDSCSIHREVEGTSGGWVVIKAMFSS